MIPDSLYDLAFQFKQTKLWRRLWDSQLFAVAHADGTIGYCCVMGMMGEHLALAVYPGAAGMVSYRLMAEDREALSYFEHQEMALGQDCVMVSFQNKSELRPLERKEAAAYCAARGLALRGKQAFPQFERFRPHYIPWYVEEEADQRHLQEALEAALEVSRRLQDAMPETLGFTEGEPYGRRVPLLTKKDGGYDWGSLPLPEPEAQAYLQGDIQDEVTRARLEKSKKRGGEWACHVFMHVDPMATETDPKTQEPTCAPFYPYLLMMLDIRGGQMLGLEVAHDPEDYRPPFVRALVETAVKLGKPSRILVMDQRSYALLERLAPLLGARLEMEEEIPALEEALDGFLEQFGENADQLEGAEEAMAQILQMMEDPQALRGIPDEMLSFLLRYAQEGSVPEAVAANLVKESRRRGMDG